MAKQTSEGSNRLSIFWLKKHSYLDGGWRYGGIKWTYGFSDTESSIGFTVEVSENDSNTIRLQYTHTDPWSGKKESMDYRANLTTTPCRYSGKRYWFICPLYTNGRYCGRRVGVLFSIGKWFGCRHCGNIAYAKQMEGGRYRWSGVSIPDIERAEKEVKRCYYRGKPTRKYRRLLRLNEKFEMGWVMMMARTDKGFARFAGLKK